MAAGSKERLNQTYVLGTHGRGYRALLYPGEGGDFEVGFDQAYTGTKLIWYLLMQ